MYNENTTRELRANTNNDPPKPDKPCFVCGQMKWWLRKKRGKEEWLCGVCHPNPNPPTS
jgi:hypothetical protein